MKSHEFIVESPETELAKKLPSLKKFDYDTIGDLMMSIAKKHDITGKKLHDLFVAKYKKIPDDWIKDKIKDKLKLNEYSSKDIIKPILERKGPEKKNHFQFIINEYKTLLESNNLTDTLNSSLSFHINSLIPKMKLLHENINNEVKTYYDFIKKNSENNNVKIKIGLSICLLQPLLDIYSHSIILKGFKNPKKITDIYVEEDKIKQIEFEDGSVFPEKYEFSTTDFGTDLLNTFFFDSRKKLESMLMGIEMVKPEGYTLATKLLIENTLDESEFDIRGLGNIPYGVDIDYFGIRVQMKPSTFLKLATPLSDEHENPYIKSYMNSGGKIAYPYLEIKIPPEWEDNDFSIPAKVVSHEGRNRMKNWIRLKGDDPVQVNIRPTGGMRRRHITPEMIKELSKGMYSEYSELRDSEYVKGPLFEPSTVLESKHDTNYGDKPIVKKFIKWCSEKLKLKSVPDIEFSYDTEQAQSGHHTGRHTPHDGKIWIYVNNRNMVDVFRTIAHELRHLQQGEQGKIKPNSSYPGSPIEVDADAWAGMVIKIFGKHHPQIFESKIL